MIELERAKQREARWRILRALDAGRPGSLSEALLVLVLHDVQLPMTELELRRELEYLHERKLIELYTLTPLWTAKLTRAGIDIVEYTIDCEPGIARPRR